jgi:hypothetical protein
MENKSLDSLYCPSQGIEDNRRALRALVKEHGRIPTRYILRAHATERRLNMNWSSYHSKQYIRLALMLRLTLSSYDKGNNIVTYMKNRG